MITHIDCTGMTCACRKVLYQHDVDMMLFTIFYEVTVWKCCMNRQLHLDHKITQNSTIDTWYGWIHTDSSTTLVYFKDLVLDVEMVLEQGFRDSLRDGVALTEETGNVQCSRAATVNWVWYRAEKGQRKSHGRNPSRRKEMNARADG